MNRRGFLRALGATFVAAPAIVRVSSLMAMPARHVLKDGEYAWLEGFYPIPSRLSTVYFQNRLFWISGTQEISFSAIQDPGTFE